MNLTIIGCWGGYPKVNEASSGYLLEHNGFRLLIDCGSGVLSNLQNSVMPEAIDAVILSHYHSDHIADIGVLKHARLIQGLLGKKVPCLPIYGHTWDELEFLNLTYKDITKGVAYDPNTVLTIGPFQITFLATAHPVPCFAMRIETDEGILIYTADTSYRDELVDFSESANLLLCECNLYGGQNGSEAGHMTSLDAGKLAELANVEKLVLTHLPHFGNLEQLTEEASQYYSGIIYLAKKNMTFNF